MKFTNTFAPMRWWKILGPGILYAGAAIGVSHLIQSTRAGANLGLTAILIVILVHIIKYPYFFFAQKYTITTGKNLITAYAGIGKWAVYTYLILTLSTMFIIMAAISVVTAGILANILNIDIDIQILSSIVIIMGYLVLHVGGYGFLKSGMKIVMLILALTTIWASISAFTKADFNSLASYETTYFSEEKLFFLIAFIGWMPAPLDITVWQSIWSETENKGLKRSLKNSLLDFNIGYWGTAFLAICFVIIGYTMLSGLELENQAVPFTKRLIDSYALELGNWSRPIISLAAFTTMLSTTIAVLDGISRSLKPTIESLTDARNVRSISQKHWLVFLVIGSLIAIWTLLRNMTNLVDLATTIAFVTTPVLAWLNIQVVIRIKEESGAVISGKMIGFSRVGLLVISFLTMLFLYLRFF